MLRQYLGKDQDTIIVIKIVLGVLKLRKHTKTPEKRLTCKAIYQGVNLLRTRPCSNAADILTYTKYHQKKKKRCEGKRHGELRCNPPRQAHKTEHAAVNNTNQIMNHRIIES